ncbi:MAG: hypothetical protein IKU43_04845 [Clostridia bacterium]|nr:hypothetical protein [Clostridia bacterium]
MKQSKYKVKRKAQKEEEKRNVIKSGLDKKLRVFLLLSWSTIALGIYFALAKVAFIYSLWFFVFVLTVAFAAYCVIDLRMAKYVRDGKADSDECTRLADISKILLIIMIPTVFIIIYDFLSTTIKMFM